MKKKMLYFLFTLLTLLAHANIASASGSHGYQPTVPDILKK